jgi:hypothetical protein
MQLTAKPFLNRLRYPNRRPRDAAWVCKGAYGKVRPFFGTLDVSDGKVSSCLENCSRGPNCRRRDSAWVGGTRANGKIGPFFFTISVALNVSDGKVSPFPEHFGGPYFYLTRSVVKVVFQKSITAQIHQHILNIRNSEGLSDGLWGH